MGNCKIYLLVGIIALNLSVAACGDDAQSPTITQIPPAKQTPPASDATPKEKLEALENSGAIPKLERTNSIAGIDANANGIRDDVEAYIAANYSNPAQRAAVIQFAGVIQDAMLVDKANVAAAKAISVRVDRAINCLYSKFDVSSGEKHPAAIGQEIESISANTKKRLLAYLAFSKALDGTVGTSPEGDTCE